MKSYPVAAAPIAIVFLAGATLRADQTFFAFSDSGQDQIQAVARDALGYLYVAGTTNSPDFPVKNAAQPQIGSAQLMRSADRGTTWVKLTCPRPVRERRGSRPIPRFRRRSSPHRATSPEPPRTARSRRAPTAG